MRKTARLDQILIRLGYVNEDQITSGLRRQKTHGGRLGMNLVQLGSLTEQQLLNALSEQFQVPVLVPDEQSVAKDLLSRMPAGVVADGQVLPLGWNDSQKVLSVATSNPGDVETMKRVRDAFDAKGVRVALAPEAVMAALGRRLGGRDSTARDGRRRVALPDLFAADTPAAPDAKGFEEPEAAPDRHVLMVTAAASRRNFLPSLFRREGCELVVVATREETGAALRGPRPFDAVLLSQEMDQEFSAWLREGSVPVPEAEVTIFSSLSEALLKNPLPYEMTVRSLRSSAQALADYRCAQLGASPPYGLIAADVEALAERHALRRIARDGLYLGVHLLLPAPGTGTDDPVGAAEPFGAFASSLELAQRIRFPWKLDALLAACHALYSGRSDPAKPDEGTEEAMLAAQILAIAWYRHNHVPALTGPDEEAMIGLRAALRAKGGRLATLDLIEGYLRFIAERGGVAETEGDRQVLLVGGERIARALSPALARVGRDALVTADLADAVTMAERRPPAAIVIDHHEFPTQVDKFSRVTKLSGASLFFVLTDSADPSLVLNLLDVGVDDVFGPPHDFDLVAARVNRAIRSRSRGRTTERAPAGQFSATFEVFSFLDLIQMLSQGLKSVRIDLSRNDSERAVVFMRKGRIIHAVCGTHSGEAGVYGVIAWEDQGEFTVKEETRFPAATITLLTESVLMEGCRLLDESKR